jgi:hypothetical protein
MVRGITKFVEKLGIEEKGFKLGFSSSTRKLIKPSKSWRGVSWVILGEIP